MVHRDTDIGHLECRPGKHLPPPGVGSAALKFSPDPTSHIQRTGCPIRTMHSPCADFG